MFSTHCGATCEIILAKCKIHVGPTRSSLMLRPGRFCIHVCVDVLSLSFSCFLSNFSLFLFVCCEKEQASSLLLDSLSLSIRVNTHAVSSIKGRAPLPQETVKNGNLYLRLLKHKLCAKYLYNSRLWQASFAPCMHK